MNPFLKVSDLSFSHGSQKILQEVSFAARTGEVIGLVGVNGAGKTTLLRLLAGLLQPDQGKIMYPVPAPPIGWVPQEVSLYPELCVADNLRLFSAGRPAGFSGQMMELAIEQLNLSSLLKKPVGQLSGGQQRKVHISVALALDPTLLLLDEPVNGIDGESAEAVACLLKTLSPGRLTLLTSHSETFMNRLASRRLYLQEGRIFLEKPSGG